MPDQIKRTILLVLLLLMPALASAQPSLCTVTGVLYDSTGSVCSNCKITISKARQGSTPLNAPPVEKRADSNGAVSFTAVQGSFVTITGTFSIGRYNFATGLEMYVPLQSSTTLTTLQTAEDALNALISTTTYAPADSPVITKTPSGSLSNEFALSTLGTGILKNTTTTGLPTIAVAETDYSNPLTFAARLDRSGNTVDLAASGVTAGTCTACDLTIDAYGRVTAKANGSGGGTVSSVFGRTGAVVAAQDDYTFAQLASKPTTLSGYGITDAQALDSDLTAIAALTPTNDDIIQRKAGAWTNRTIAQLKADLSLSGSNTGDQTITLTGDVTGSGTGSFAATLANLPSGVPMAGSLLATNIAAPSTPATGKTSVYVDSTSKNFAAKNDAGTVNHGVQTRTASASNWIRAIADDGSTTISQPAFTDISGSVAASQMPALTGDVTTSAGAVATTIGANKVTNAMLATVSTATFKGRTTAGTGNVEDLTATQATALLNAMVGDSGSGGTKGLVPAPASGDAAAGKFLKADGTWAATPGSGITVNATTITGGASGAVPYNNAGVYGESNLNFASSALFFTRNSIGTAQTTGHEIANTTAAAAGAQQFSPCLVLTSQGWKTNSTAASQSANWCIQAQPVQGAANPTVNLAFLYQVNGGGYSNAIATGQLLAPGGGSTSQSVPQYSAVNNSTYGFRIGKGNAGNAVSLVAANTYLTADANVNAIYLKSNAGLVWGDADSLASRQAGFSSPANNQILANGTSTSLIAGLNVGRVVTAKTSNYSVVVNDSNTFFTNTGASGTVNFTLPTAAAGLTYTFYVDAAQTLTITAGASTTIRSTSSVTASAGNITTSTVGNVVKLVAISTTQWVAESIGGTWTFN